VGLECPTANREFSMSKGKKEGEGRGNLGLGVPAIALRWGGCVRFRAWQTGFVSKVRMGWKE
jgi:hypothetical protein